MTTDPTPRIIGYSGNGPGGLEYETVEMVRERLANLDHFDPHREQTDLYDRREDEDGYLTR